MTTKKDSATTREVNLAPGVAALVLAMAITAMGFYAGASIFPLGGVAIAGCCFAAVQMMKTNRVFPGYAAVIVAIFSMAAALALPVQG